MHARQEALNRYCVSRSKSTDEFFLDALPLRPRDSRAMPRRLAGRRSVRISGKCAHGITNVNDVVKSDFYRCACIRHARGSLVLICVYTSYEVREGRRRPTVFRAGARDKRVGVDAAERVASVRVVCVRALYGPGRKRNGPGRRPSVSPKPAASGPR